MPDRNKIEQRRKEILKKLDINPLKKLTENKTYQHNRFIHKNNQQVPKSPFGLNPTYPTANDDLSNENRTRIDFLLHGDWGSVDNTNSKQDFNKLISERNSIRMSSEKDKIAQLEELYTKDFEKIKNLTPHNKFLLYGKDWGKPERLPTITQKKYAKLIANRDSIRKSLYFIDKLNQLNNTYKKFKELQPTKLVEPPISNSAPPIVTAKNQNKDLSKETPTGQQSNSTSSQIVQEKLTTQLNAPVVLTISQETKNTIKPPAPTESQYAHETKNTIKPPAPKKLPSESSSSEPTQKYNLEHIKRLLTEIKNEPKNLPLNIKENINNALSALITQSRN